MRTAVCLFSVTVLFFSLFLVSSGYCEGFFSCEDTIYSSSGEQSILRSRYHLVQLFGDVSYRTSNFFEDDYDGFVAWVENRILVRFSEFVNTPIPLPDPFFIGILKGLKDIDWEDRLDYGMGIEWRPFKQREFSFKPTESSQTGWIGHVRLYAVYLFTKYLQYRDEWSWRPDDDLRIGAELYRECNLYNSEKFWGEFWADGSWRKTNFYIDDYEGWTFAFVPKLGIKLSPYKESTFMPYLTGEIAITNRSEFWQNRALVGGGIRYMPLRWSHVRRPDISTFARGLKFYVEYLRVATYFKDEAPWDTPDSDIRFGLNLTINRWW